MKVLGFKDFFTSGWMFQEKEWALKSQYQMLNFGLVSSSFALLYGIAGNYVRDVHGIILVESFLLFMNILLFFLLRKDKKYIKIVSWILTFQFSIFFLFLFYQYEPDELKHIWLFTFPIILLFFQEKKSAVYWILFMVVLLVIAPLQGIVETSYSLFQATYISVVLVIVSIIIYFYQDKMDKARRLILQQQSMLKSINIELANQVDELKLQDQLLSSQSKQAVMGEMISMIAHQWRQPLSTVTLQIASLEIEKKLGHDVDAEDVDKVLANVSDTIIYLSDTIDDFQTYFHPKKEKSEIELDELIGRVINFSKPRLKGTRIKIEFAEVDEIFISTYINELIQVLLNIVNNAVDALLEDDIKNPKIYIKAQVTASDSVIVKISDNAKGISSENMEHLFEPYFSTKGKNGTGLGLYMSQMIMQKQFGTIIEVQSSKDGSIFKVEIPIDIK